MPTEISKIFNIEVDKLMAKFVWNVKESHIAQTILKQNKVGGLMLYNFTTHYKAIVIKSVHCLHKDREKCSRIDSPEVNTYIYGHLILDSVVKTIQWGNNIMSTGGAETTGYPKDISC